MMQIFPLAARRALTLTGCHVPLRTWASLPTRVRNAIVIEGMQAEPSREAILRAMHGRLRDMRLGQPGADPPAHRPPESLARALGTHPVLAEWPRLDRLERYALVEGLIDRDLCRALANRFHVRARWAYEPPGSRAAPSSA